MDQKNVFIALGIISILIFSGCIGEEKEPSPAGEVSTTISITAEEIRDKSVEAMNNVHSYAFDMDIQIYTIEGEKGASTMDMVGKGKIDMGNKKMHNKVEMNVMGMSMITETYIINNMQYIMMPLTGWVKNETDEGVWATQDLVKSHKDVMEDIEVKLIGSEKVNGVDCYILEMKPSQDELLELLGPQMDAISGISSTEISEMIKSMELKNWIAKDTFLTRRTTSDMQIEMKGNSMNMKITMDTYDYNKPLNIELPEEAKNAQDIDDLMETEMPGY